MRHPLAAARHRSDDLPVEQRVELETASGGDDGKSILVITGDGGESHETLYAVHRMREEGYEAKIAAPSRKRLNLVMHDFEPGWDTYIEKPGSPPRPGSRIPSSTAK